MIKSINILKKYRKYLIILLISFVFIFLFYMCLTPYDYCCFKCGAYKTQFGKIIKNPISEYIEKINSKKCEHKWIVNSYMYGFVDCFAAFRIPICNNSTHIMHAVDSIPEDSWKKDLINAMTDEKNKLKWVVAMVLNELSMELDKTKNDFDWELWREKYAEIFYPEYDLNKARGKADKIMDKIKNNEYSDFRNSYNQSNYHELQRDLELEKKTKSLLN